MLGRKVFGPGVGVPGPIVGVSGPGVDVAGSAVGVPGPGVDVAGSAVGVPGPGVDVAGSAVGVPGSGVDVFIGVREGVTGVEVGTVEPQDNPDEIKLGMPASHAVISGFVGSQIIVFEKLKLAVLVSDVKLYGMGPVKLVLLNER